MEGQTSNIVLPGGTVFKADSHVTDLRARESKIDSMDLCIFYTEKSALSPSAEVVGSNLGGNNTQSLVRTCVRHGNRS